MSGWPVTVFEPAASRMLLASWRLEPGAWTADEDAVLSGYWT